MEAVAAVLTLHHGVVPAMAGCGEVDDAIDLDVVRGNRGGCRTPVIRCRATRSGSGGTTRCRR
ncbi:hypothetical protein AB0420_18445 [Streptomyces caelestis]|nr:hypothetical protein [Streptomyces sp. XY152]